MQSLGLGELNPTTTAGVATTMASVPTGLPPGQGRRANAWLWIGQGVLAFIFLFAGGFKLALPLDVLTAQLPLPGLFVRVLGCAEVLGAIGLILPGLLRIRPGLTPLAAAGLVIVMIGATTLTLASGQIVPALLPLIVGILATFVAYGRWAAVRTLYR